MAKRAAATLSPLLTIDHTQKAALHKQIYDNLRLLILEGRLSPGWRVPSSRLLAQELGVSRMTVVVAFEQLLAEGYLASKTGAGTFVAHVLPDDLLRPTAPAAPKVAASPQTRHLSKRGSMLAATQTVTAPDEGTPRAFRPGLPDFSAFPMDIWRKLTEQRYRNPPLDFFSYGDPAGYMPLRRAIASYLTVSRGVRCAIEQVLIVSGSQQALDLTARLLLDPGDAVWIEDPGYRGAKAALLAAGAQLAPVPLDSEGLDLAAGQALCPTALLAYVTPSHQFPLGVTMSLSRRLALLDWARRADAWIVEDDYDSEYRYADRPFPALQGLDTHNRVIYIGTFSKVLFPSLRLGYLVVPPDLVDAFVTTRALLDRHSPTLQQAVLADFIESGHFARHLRRMRTLYAARQECLVAAARSQLVGIVDMQPNSAGMQLIGRLVNGMEDKTASRLAQAHGIDVPPLSAYALGPAPEQGLVFGYTAFAEDVLAAGVSRLARALQS